jgi:hypothetical protein
MTLGTNDAHRLKQIGGIPAGEEIQYTKRIKPNLLLEIVETDPELCI